MSASLNRIILYVQDVERLSAFYQDAFSLSVVEHIESEWAVLKAGACEIALHRVGKPYRISNPSAATAMSNAKLVLTVDREIAGMRTELLAKGVKMGPIKSLSWPHAALFWKRLGSGRRVSNIAGSDHRVPAVYFS